MNRTVARSLRSLKKRLGLGAGRAEDAEVTVPADIDPDAARIIRQVRSRTMTSPERLFALIQAVRHVSAAGIPGDFVECGVWRGGSMMAAALTLLGRGDTDRRLHLFDTFDGMSPPTSKDVDIVGHSADALLNTQDRNDPESAWCQATLDDVQAGMRDTGYPESRMRFVKGKVEETIPAHAPDAIALLRLDTDWYESTRHELEHLYPRLSKGGVLIIDDYGHWQGAREAVDEYLKARNIHLLLCRVDYTGRMAVKTE